MSDRHSRREFMGLAAAGVAGALTPEWVVEGRKVTKAAAASANPDLVVTNAKVYTMDPTTARAEAFAVKGGRFVAIGTTKDIKGLAGKGTVSYDALGMTVVPGFIDCHNHAGGTTLLYEVLVGNPYEVEFVSIDSIIQKLRAKAQTLPPNTWVEGYFHDDTKLTDKRPLTRQDLDKVSTQHPVAVNHRGGHTGFYNTKAFEMSGITKDTPNPAGGTYDKDASGELNGRVTDRARNAMGRGALRPQLSAAERQKQNLDGIAYISKQFVRYGLTTVHHEGGDLTGMQDVRARGEQLHRVSYEVSGNSLDAMLSTGIRSGFGDEWFKLGATSEYTVDGSFSERTMALSQPYPGSNPPYSGNVTVTQETLNAYVERVHRGGVQINCHANGDVAIDMYLTAYELAQQKYPRTDARPKITHCTLINDDIVRRMKAVGATPALFTTYAYYNSDKFPFYGEDLMKRCMAYRTLIDAGLMPAAGSDFAPGPFAPLMGIQGMVSRKGWDNTSWGVNQRITVDEAIRVNTLHGAYNSHEEALKGSITEGKLADFVVLAEDPHTIAPDKIKDIMIVQTVVGGAVAYQS